MPSPTFTGEYAKDGKAIREAARASVGRRCIRCGHPFQCGVTKLEGGVWSPCDNQCTHAGELRFNTNSNIGLEFPWSYSGGGNVLSPKFMLLALPEGTIIQARSRILTVHHFDGNKENDRWFNLLPLCQRCHLQVQTRVNPEIPWLFEHSDWLKPYVAGFYALKYLGQELSRKEVEADMEKLLALERRI